jgi:hypothetical protein
LSTESRHRPIGRLALALAAVAIAGTSAFLAWRMTTLSGLPDIGDPFDVAAFDDIPVADDENAFVLYREAVGKIGEEPEDMSYDWATAGPVEKGWLERNREALEIWRRGTERPKALYVPMRSQTVMTRLVVIGEIRKFTRLTKLEGGRLEAEGDLEGAWRWYRAVFRSSRHVAHRSLAIPRLVSIQMHDQACQAMTRWSKDPQVTPAMLRQALDAAIEDYKATGPLSDNLKVEYLAFLKSYKDPDLFWKCLNDEGSIVPGNRPWFARDARVFSVSKSLLKEPERSRRVTRLVFANLLTACDQPPDRRTVACSLPASFGVGSKSLVDLYVVDGSATSSARSLPPDKILEWFQTTLFTKSLTPVFVNNIVKAADSERVAQANLLIALANRLYEIERGKPLETVEELVGPYLKSLPEGYKPIE